MVRGSCVCSSNFQGDACSPDGNPMTGRRLTHDKGSDEISNEETTYQNNEACHIEFAEPVMLSVYQFDVEQAYDCVYDALIVNREKYCGTSGPEGQMATSLDWTTDGSVTRGGFKVCTPCTSADATWVESSINVGGGSWDFEITWTLSCVGMCIPIMGMAPYNKPQRVPAGV